MMETIMNLLKKSGDKVDEFLKTLPGLGIGGVLALFIYLQSRKDSEAHTTVIREYHENERGRTELLVNVVKDNTVATTKNNVVLDALHRRLDREEYEKMKNG